MAWKNGKKKKGMSRDMPWERCAMLARPALARGQVSFEVIREKSKGAFNRRAGHSDQIAKPFILIESENFAELFKHGLAALAGLHFF